MAERIRWFGRLVVRLLDVKSDEEREKRAAHLFALVLVSLVAAVKDVSGVTLYDAPFTLFALAIAASAARGGLAPAVVATLAATLLGGLSVLPPGLTVARLVFAAEGLSVALLVSAMRSAGEHAAARLEAAQERIAELKQHDLGQRHEWDDYREAAAQAQAALQKAADDARQQLRALESLTDPWLNPFGGPGVVSELLERLRTAVGADGAALVQPRPADAHVLAAGGLQAAGRDGDETPTARRCETPPLAPGRVAVVHNDRARVDELSALSWSADVTSLLVVPVVHDGQVRSAIEVASERARQVSDWDVALVRIVADRLAGVVVQDGRA